MKNLLDKHNRLLITTEENNDELEDKTIQANKLKPNREKKMNRDSGTWETMQNDLIDEHIVSQKENVDVEKKFKE